MTAFPLTNNSSKALSSVREKVENGEEVTLEDLRNLQSEEGIGNARNVFRSRQIQVRPDLFFALAGKINYDELTGLIHLNVAAIEYPISQSQFHCECIMWQQKSYDCSLHRHGARSSGFRILFIKNM